MKTLSYLFFAIMFCFGAQTGMSQEFMIGLEGERYKAVVPDTLDLAHRAELALNAIAGTINPELDYEGHWRQNYVPPGVVNHSNQWFDINPRAAEMFVTLRLVTGSEKFGDIENGMMKSMLSRLGDDGLYYNAPYRDDAPWRAGGYGGRKNWRTDEDYNNVSGNSLLLTALIYRYQVSRDPAIFAHAKKLAEGMIRIAICRDDYAYYPSTSKIGFDHGYFRESGWPETEEAQSEVDNPEGTVACYMSWPARALAQWYALTGDEKALDTARRLVNYMLKPKFWLGNMEGWDQDVKRVWAAHGGLQRKPAAIFKGHIAGLAYTLHGLIEYANITNDAYIKEFVRQGYEYIRNYGLVRIGMYGENIANSIMAVVAIRLSDAGVGDYYEDVDQHIRNAMVDDQITDANRLKQLCAGAGVSTQEGDFTIERLLGSLRHDGVFRPDLYLDPTAMATRASPYLEPYYYVWESIIRYKDGAAHVNLLLNRASPWLDVDSYLPYEGKVVIKNKTAKNVVVRIPRWVDKKQVTCLVDDTCRSFFWTGNYLSLTNLKGKETITIKFPMVETTERYYLLPYDAQGDWYKHKDSWPRYVLHIKGNTCIKVEFPNKAQFGGNDFKYACYQRDHYRRSQAPMKKVTRYVAPRLVAW